MSYVIVEITKNWLGTSVEVVGPFEEERAAEMIRRNRHFDRSMSSSHNASQTDSYVRKVETP